MPQTVRDLCKLQPNALNFNVSDGVERLDELIREEGDGSAYFDRTHVTAGMRELIEGGVARLAGKSESAIFHLKQAMGGGKTHLLVGFGLLAKNPVLRERVCGAMHHADGFGEVKVAAFNGRDRPGSYFWGEIAKQLGRGEQFRRYWEGGPDAPDERAWLELFEGGEPTLILLDELPPYFHYYGQQTVGTGTVADIVTNAFANLLTAAGKKSNVCVVVSDLDASYAEGQKRIASALADARQELGRQERAITPVDLEGNEVYDILRKRLFASLPGEEAIDDLSDAYTKALAEARKAKVATRSAEAVAEEIGATYPFHPQFKNIVALFKENETYRQTRGLMEFVSRLLKSVWEREANDVFLIGPQHFDLGLPGVRSQLTSISRMPEVLAKDLWDVNGSAHAQEIDGEAAGDRDHAAQVGTLLLVASLSTAVNAVRGLTTQEMVECLIAPMQDAQGFLDAFERLEKRAWYLHHDQNGRYYFDKQENLTKLLQNLAEKAPENKVDEEIATRLNDAFRPRRKVAYAKVLALPKIEDAVREVAQGRVLLIQRPDGKAPPEAIADLFSSLPHKNNLLVLTGGQTRMADLEGAARKVFAVRQAETRIPAGSPQREELQQRKDEAELGFTSIRRALFNELWLPFSIGGTPTLKKKTLQQEMSNSEPYDGEALVEQTLAADPRKLYLDVEKDLDALRDRAEDLLFPTNQTDARWADMRQRLTDQAGMPWMPPGGLETLRDAAVQQGRWEDLGNGYLTKSPRPKQATVQVTPEGEPNDNGEVRLRVNTQHAGPGAKVYVVEDGTLDEADPVALDDGVFVTKALRAQFIVKEPGAAYKAEPFTWKNKLKIRNRLLEGTPRRLELHVAPRGEIRFTLDGSEPRNGTAYAGPVELPDGEVTVLAYAEADGLEAKATFSFAAKGQTAPKIDAARPAEIASTRGAGKKLDSREKVYGGLSEAKERGVRFRGVSLTIGNGDTADQFLFGDRSLTPEHLKSVLDAAVANDAHGPDAPLTLAFRHAAFRNGHDLEAFAKAVGIELAAGEVVQP